MEAITFVGLDVHKRRDLSGWVRSGPPGRMRPTEVLQGLRARALAAAPAVPGGGRRDCCMSKRTFRRWRERYDAEGRACSIDGSGRRQPDGRRSTR